MWTIKKQLLEDLRIVERELEQEEFAGIVPENSKIFDRKNPAYFGILRILYHLLTAEIMRIERNEKNAYR